MRQSELTSSARVPVAFLLILGALLTGCGSGSALEPSSPPGSSRAVLGVASSPSPTVEGLMARARKEGAALRGVPDSAAKAKAETDGFVFRVVERDGQWLGATFDLVPLRINVVVQDGVVVSTSAG